MIWLYKSQEQLRGALAPNSRDWIGGAIYANLALIVATATEGEERGLLRMLPHEIVHQVFFDATDNPFVNPATWLDEGLAGYGQRAAKEGYDDIALKAYREGALPSLQSMISEWGSLRDDATIAYAASYSVVTFIIDSMGEAAIVDLVAAYREGLSHDQAVEQALGMSMDELDERWRDALSASAGG
jgi:hypothetical protein